METVQVSSAVATVDVSGLSSFFLFSVVVGAMAFLPLIPVDVTIAIIAILVANYLSPKKELPKKRVTLF